MSKNPPPGHTLYNCVAQVREELGLTQATLAQRTGVTRSNIYQIEHRQVIPSLLTALKIAEVLQIDVNKLFFYDLEKHETEVQEFEQELKEILSNSGRLYKD